MLILLENGVVMISGYSQQCRDDQYFQIPTYFSDNNFIA